MELKKLPKTKCVRLLRQAWEAIERIKGEVNANTALSDRDLAKIICQSQTYNSISEETVFMIVRSERRAVSHLNFDLIEHVASELGEE